MGGTGDQFSFLVRTVPVERLVARGLNRNLILQERQRIIAEEGRQLAMLGHAKDAADRNGIKLGKGGV